MDQQNMRTRQAWLSGVVLLAVVVALLAWAPTRAQAQNYSFSIPRMQMEVFVQDDASARIVYDITFQNAPSASPIDIVDIGTPHDDYDTSNMSASINGTPLNTIRPSEYIDTGVEIPLGSNAIAPGEQATLNFEFTMPDMVYGDTTQGDYASLQITPTWFDSSLVNGTTQLQIAVHMLPGIEPDEVLFQDVPFDNKAIFDDHVVVVWEEPDWRATGPYRVGVSFPERGISGVIRMNAFQLAVKWVEDNPPVRFFLTGALVVLLGIVFFRFTGNTGCSVFVVVAGILGFLAYSAPALLLLSFLPMPLLIFFNERHLRTRRNKYLPPIAQVEGGGIKRGLTAPEAAVILEQPINKVLTLVIFGLLKKGVLRQVKDDPLQVEVAEAFRTGSIASTKDRKSHRLKAAQEAGTILHTYEHGFLDLIERRPDSPLKDIDFGTPMKELIAHAAARVKGFDLSDTQDYYRSITRRALKEASEIQDIEQREKRLDRNLEWVLMNDDFGGVFDAPRYGYRYRPMWTRPIFIGGLGGSGGGGGGGAPSGGGPSVGGSTSFSDVAASFAGWTENTMGNMADAIAPGSLQAPDVSGGVVDLSGADKVTADFFEALAESSAKGGGGGGGCACAGCACACACAGGGR
jgi:hypothetical protein